MKTETYKKLDGTEGQTLTFEDKDEVIASYDKPFHTKADATRGQIYDDYVMGVKLNDNKLYIKLTPTQFKQLMEKQPLTNKTIKCESYTNAYGTFVGLRVE